MRLQELPRMACPAACSVPGLAEALSCMTPLSFRVDLEYTGTPTALPELFRELFWKKRYYIIIL